MISEIIDDVCAEMSRALSLQDQGKIGRTPSDPESTNVESIAVLNEEVGEVNLEVVQLLAAMLGLNEHAAKATHTVNDLEQILFRWHLDSPKRIDPADLLLIAVKRAKLDEELIQVAAVAIAFVMRLRDEAASLGRS